MIAPEARQALSSLLGDAVQFDAPLAKHTSWCVGGPADALATPNDREALAALLALCAQHRLPQRVLGGGFNTLVLDEGVDGVLIRLHRLRQIELIEDTTIRAEAGVSHASLVKFCEQRGLAGLEFGIGIPGTLGGWLRMNAGIGDREMKDVVQRIETCAADGSGFHWHNQAALEFQYRELCGIQPGEVIVAAELRVEPSTQAAVSAEIARLRAKRVETQPLDAPSCGSVFRNPPGDYAGRLIEAADLKGESVGAAEISSLHANFIINRGGAKASDILALIEKTRALVEERTGVRLETEVHVMGRSTP